ncbi:MAG TPA: HD domain-containing protein [Longilinea sp.]|nr:HD domain-containing protein [Longilinea sp.]
MTPDKEIVIQACIQLARTLEYEAEHTHQVTRLALLLFDGMISLHQLGEKERYWLQCAGLLHDIGWVEGWKGHHKTSLRIIQTTQLLPLENKERLIIGSIARYHRKALPEKSHDHFAALEPAEQEKVKTLSALLRVADGLDASHQSRVGDILVHITKKRILIRCAIKSLTAIEEEISATNKSDLMVKVFHRTVNFRWKSIL